MGVLGQALAWQHRFCLWPTCWEFPLMSLGVSCCQDWCCALRRGAPFHRAAVARAHGATKVVEPTRRGWVLQQVEVAILANMHIDETFLASMDVGCSIKTT